MTQAIVLVVWLIGALAAPPLVASAQEAGTAEPDANVVAGEYLLDSGDVLKITVLEEAQLSGTQFRVDTDGAFQYPYLGRVMARGKSTREIQAEVTRRLADGWLTRPIVTVEIEQYRPQSVYVIGEVRSPAQYPMQGSMTVLEALARAGYMTPTAGTQALILRKPDGDPAGAGAGPAGAGAGPAAPGADPAAPGADPAAGPAGSRQIRVSLPELLAGRPGANIALQDGDTVIVLQAQKFYVSGQVKSPGQFNWEPDLTVRAAIILAGGLSDRGSSRRVRIIRLVEENGEKVEQRFDVDLDDPVLPGDTIEVRQRLL